MSSWENISQIASKISAVECFFTDHLKSPFYFLQWKPFKNGKSALFISI